MLARGAVHVLPFRFQLAIVVAVRYTCRYCAGTGRYKSLMPGLSGPRSLCLVLQRCQSVSHDARQTRVLELADVTSVCCFVCLSCVKTLSP